VGKRSRSKHDRDPKPQQSVAVAPPTPDLRRARILATILFAATLLSFSHVIKHDFVSFDDPIYITQNGHVRTGLSAANIAWAFTTYHAFNWHPLTWISHQLDVSLFGVEAGRLAAINVLFHALSGVLLFFLMRRMTGRTFPSAAIAALFALHPAHVESVAWISERKDVLSTLLFLATIWFYVEERYLLTIGVFALALLAKPMVVTLPLVLLLLDWWPLKRGLRIKEKLPLFAMVIPAIILTLRAQSKGIAVGIPLAERLGNAIQSYVAYLMKLAWPANLAIIYPMRPPSPALTLGALLVLLAITAAALYFARRAPFAIVGWLWYLGTLVPVIGIIQVGRQAMADRYTYIPSIGIFIIVAFLIDRLRVPRNALIGATAVIVAIFAILTFRQTQTWENSVTLYRHALEVTTNNDIAHTLLGEVYNGAHDTAAAERELKAAIDINPTNEEALLDFGRLKLATGKTQDAIPLLERALKSRDDVATRAALERARGNFNGALAAYQQAVHERPELADRHNDYAAMLASMGRDDEAIEHYNEALRIDPAQYDAHMNLGAILSRRNDNHQAIEQFKAAAANLPSSPEPHVYLALVYASERRFLEAVSEVKAAKAIDHDEANAQLTNAVHLQPNPTNIDAYEKFLEAQR
jgi:protein O-mannosyl-transferase